MLPLQVRGAEIRRRGKRLVGPIDLVLDGAGPTIVIGPNGAGKTTLLRMLHGIERLSAGELRWACGLEQARLHQAFVFQTPVMMRRSVLDNIAYPLRLSGTPGRDARARAAIWAGRVGLAGKEALPARVLSGGERQKLALARALIREPEVLFLDEPCANLDGRSVREIETILCDAVSRGTRLVMSTHDMGQARRLAAEVIFLLHGRIHEQATAAAFFDAPATVEAAAFLKGEIVE